MNINTKKLRDEWNKRNKLLGNSKQAVLFKRFPKWLNNYIHNKHMNFILKNISSNCANILDVGCGYGRISQEIKNKHSKVNFTGIELSKDFSKHYEENIGKCFNIAIQDFTPTQKYDTVIVVTLLMYLDDTDLENTIKKLWSCLSLNGTMICIEPAIEFTNLWKTITRTKNASPTGGEVKYFTFEELEHTFPLKSIDRMSLRLIPFLKHSTLHHGIIIKKTSNTLNI